MTEENCVCIISNILENKQARLIMSETGIIILAHGSRGARGIVEVPEALRGVTEGVKSLLPPGVEVTWAALQFNHPSLEEASGFLVTKGVHRIIIMPYFLFPGRHITEDIPQLIERLKSSYPDKKFIMTNPVGLEIHLINQVLRCIEEAAPELWFNARVPSLSPEAIEQKSLDIVEKLLSPALDISEDKRLVVKRIVHASGDPQLAFLVRFSPSAVSDGLNAVVKGSPIFTDVNMVAAGINRHVAEAFKCSISCALEEVHGQRQRVGQNTTRAAAAMRHLGKRLNGAIAVIGNAPTALMALLDLIDSGIKPALVVGMPVGFVQAKESKEELMKRKVPYVTVIGTRGGSAVAVATVNALLRIAAERNDRKG